MVNMAGARMRARLIWAVVFQTLFTCLLFGCGGGGGDGGGAPPPSGLSYSSPNIYAVGTEIGPLKPTVTGTVTSYSVSPALPGGLTLDASSGVISGTPSAPAATAAYTVTARNASGSVNFALSLTVAAVAAAPGQVARTVVSTTSVDIVVAVTPVNFKFAGSVTAQANDPQAMFDPDVAATTSGDVTTLVLNTNPRTPPGHYSGSVQIKLCSDTACASPQFVPSVALPFDIDVLDSTSEWPGDHRSALVAWAGVADWSTFQGNAAHTGYVPVAVDPNAFTTRWQTPAIDVPVDWSENLNTLVTANGMFFISGGNVLYARSESDGTVAWQYDFSGLPFPSANPPAVSNGRVFIAAGQQSSTYMWAFNAADGALVFKTPMSSQWEHYLAPSVGASGVYTNAGTYGGLFAFTPAGQSLFTAFEPQTSVWTPAVDGNAVYVYAGGGLTVADPVTGATTVTIADPTYQNYIYEIGGSPVLGAAGSVFVANYANWILNGGGIGNTLLRFDTAAGAIAWQVAGNYPATPAYDAGVLYAVNNFPVRLEARAEADGALLWSWVPPQAGDTGFASEVLLTTNLVFVSTNLATYAIDRTSQHTVWSYPQTGKLALSQNGVLYIEGRGSQSGTPAPGYLSAINLK